MIDRLPEDAQTLLAQTFALVLATESARGWSHLSGSFSVKTQKGSRYAYFQYSDPGGTRRQFSIGRVDDEVLAVIERYRDERATRDDDERQIERLAGLLRAAGVTTMPHGPARVLRALADAGVFRWGGVLVGSHAFAAIGNLLGVRWPSDVWRTQDIDIAGHLELAVPEVIADVPKALDSLQMGFVPVPELDPRHPSTSFRVRGKTLQVDLLTPGTSRDSRPVYIPRFRAAAAPIRHLSLLMHDAAPGVMIDGGAIAIVVPTPARFALHELFVSQTRSVVQQPKSGKGLRQAALLLEVLAEDRPEDLEVAARAFAAAGPVVTRKVERGLAIATRRWPEITDAGDLLLPLLQSTT